MTDFLPTQEPGPGPTDAPLATYQSYSAYTTSIYDFTTTITRIAYNPAGTLAPSLVIETETSETTSIGYSVVNIPLLYTGPFPAPPLGTLFTTPGQVITASSSQASPTSSTPSATQPTATGAATTNSNAQGSSPSQPISAPSPVSTVSHGHKLGQGSAQTGGISGGSQAGTQGSQEQGTTSNPTETGQGSNGGNGKGTEAGSGTATATATGNGTANAGGNGSGGNGGSSAAGQSAGSGAGSGQGSGSGSDTTTGTATNNSNSITTGPGTASSSQASATSVPRPSITPSPSNSKAASSIANSVSKLSTSASQESVIASQESVSASNAAASASQASISATNAAQSSSASVESASAASAASSASMLSASASAASKSASSLSVSLTSSIPTSSTGGLLPPGDNNLARNGLSGGQIAGIVLGSVFGLLLLLLALLILARRRKRKAGNGMGGAGQGMGRKLSDKWASGFSQPGERGTYAALGAGAGAAGVGLAAAGGGGRGSLHSDEWEEDRLSGGDGSGFFVVGGRQSGGSEGGNGSSFNRGERNRASSNLSSAAAAGGLAGLGAGIVSALGVAGKRKRGSNKGKSADHQAVATSSQEADLADEDDIDQMLASDEDGDVNNERRGLMSFGDVGDLSEMRQAGPSQWTRTPSRGGEGYAEWDKVAEGGAAAALGARALYAGHRNKPDEDQGYQERGNIGSSPSAFSQGGHESTWMAGGVASPSIGRSAAEGYSSAAETSTAGRHLSSNSGTGSGSGTRETGSGSGPNASSNSTGVRTDTQDSPDIASHSYGNLGPSSDPSRQSRLASFTGGFGDGDLGLGQGQQRDTSYGQDALLGAAGGVGLAALAAGHRDSGASQVESDNGHEDRYSRFISKDTPLLGPEAGQKREQQQQQQQRPPIEPPSEAKNPPTFGTAFTHQNRLPTIRSVGEFGEQGSIGPPSQMGSGGTVGTGSGSGTRSGYGSVRSAPLYASSAGPSTSGLPFSTPIASPGMDQNPFDDGQQLRDIPDERSSTQRHGEGRGASVAALGAGVAFLGGLVPGFSRWTRSDKEEEDRQPKESEEVQTGRAGRERGHESEPGMAAEVQSQRASVYNNGSTMDHGLPSAQVSHSPSLQEDAGSGSGSGSGIASIHGSVVPLPLGQRETLAGERREEGQDREDIYEQGEEAGEEDPFDEEGAVGGYAASVSNLSQNVSSGNSRSASRRSGQTTSTGNSRVNTSGTNSNSQSNSGTSSSRRNQSSSGGSTGAASYNPSYIARQSSSSTRGGAVSSSLSSRGAARGGGQSSSSRRRRDETDADNDSSMGGGGGDSDDRSSRATAGGGEDLARLSLDPGLGSVREGQEEVLPSSDFYPSESLGAAVRRRAAREAQEAAEQREFDTPRLHPASLTTSDQSQWRQSPRVESASQRAAAANLVQSGAPYQRPDVRDTFGQHQADDVAASPRRSRLPDPEEARTQQEQEDQGSDPEAGNSSRDRGIWPKFLRF